MNPKRFLICIAAAMVTVFVSDMMIHGLLMKPDYETSKSLWRSEAEMERFFGWLMAGEFMVALGMTLLWLKGFAENACVKCVAGFGLSAGLVASAYVPVFYAVMPLPGLLAVKWLVFGLLQSLLVTTVLFGLSRPKAA